MTWALLLVLKYRAFAPDKPTNYIVPAQDEVTLQWL